MYIKTLGMFEAQMDYVFFLYGLAFVFLGILAFILHMGKSSKLPWIWLAAFGFLHGINEWIDMLKFVFPGNPVLDLAGLGMMSASFLALLAFGRKALAPVAFASLLIMLAVLLCLGAWSYPNEIPQFIRYGIGFPGAFLSALLLWRQSGCTPCMNLKIAALGLGIYAVVSGLIVPAGTFILSSAINHDTFLNLFGFPVQIVRMVLAVIVALGIWSYYVVHQNFESYAETPIHLPEARKLLLFLAAVSFGGFFLVNAIGDRKEALMVEEFIKTASITAQSVDCIAVASLSGEGSGYDVPLLKQLQNRLNEINTASGHVHLISIRHDAIHFLVDPKDVQASDRSHNRAHHTNVSPLVLTAIQTGKPFVIGSQKDRFGNWITAVIPFGTLTATGEKVYLLFEMDYARWKSELALTRQWVIAIILLSSIFISYYFAASNKIFQISAKLDAEKNLFIGGPVVVIKWKLVGGRWRVTYASGNLHSHLQITPEVMLAREYSFLEEVHPDDQPLFLKGIEKLQHGALTFEHEIRLRHADGSYQWFHLFVLRQYDRHGEWFQGYFTEISSRKEAEKSAVYLATHDVLTGLPTIALLEEFFAKALVAAKLNETKMALMYLDIDRFNRINEVFGHSFGNTFILSIAKRLEKSLRETDTIGRYGGDEFVILVPMQETNDDIALIAEKILREIAQPFTINEETMTISCSIGIAVFPDDGDKIETLMQQADAALAEAKNSGRATYVFASKSENEKIAQRLMIGNYLHTALANGEFSLHYQPQIDFKSNRVTGAEALLRWNNPVLGNVSPEIFIPIAEEIGLIVPIGEWVLEEACRQNRLWQQQGSEGLSIAVNMSSLQLKRPDFISTVKSVLERTSLSPEFLELELTESVLANEQDIIIVQLRELQKMGITISIDDFGTGYSNFLYLKRFSVSKLKIDRSFIASLEQEAESRAIVDTMIQFAKTLRLITIAEGVEDQGQLDILGEYGCNEIQGYYFSKPLLPSAFEAYVLLKNT